MAHHGSNVILSGLEGELQAAHKECELLRQKIRHLENDLEDYKKKNTDLTAEVTEKSGKHLRFEL